MGIAQSPTMDWTCQNAEHMLDAYERRSHGKIDLLNAHVTRWLHRRRARPLWLGRSRGRRSALLHQCTGIAIRHLSLRTEDVRNNGVLGDGSHGSRSATVRA